MRNLNEILTDIDLKTKQLNAYSELYELASSLYSNICDNQSSFIKASEKLEIGLNIAGKPADNGKTKELSDELNGMAGIVEEEMGLIVNEIKKLEEELENLQNEYRNAESYWAAYYKSEKEKEESATKTNESN